MKRIRLRTVFVYTLAVLAGALLLHTSQSVQKAEEELAAITAAARSEQDSIRVLKTEWAFLNNPGRLETLARHYLKLSPPDPGKIGTDGANIPARGLTGAPAELQPKSEMQARPVSFTAPPSPKPAPPAATSPATPRTSLSKEKSLDDLIRQVTEGAE